MADPKALNELDYIQAPPVLEQIIARTKVSGFAMASEPRTGALLRALAASKPGGRFLELGTGTGIATAWLLEGMDSTSTLTSVDTNAEVQQVAHEFLASDPRLTLVLQDGLEFLKQAPAESYDFVFADAMPGKYEGLPACLSAVKPGGLYVIDDVLEQPNWPDGHAAKVPVLLRELANRQDLAIIPIPWSSGIVVAAKRSGSTSSRVD